MAEAEWLAQRFEADRSRLRALAYRMLGSLIDADDAVQEAWLRLTRKEPHNVDNLGGWLTTVVARVCLDMLRSRASRREESLDEQSLDQLVGGGGGADPEQEALIADSVGPALLLVLDTLTPSERLAFVLHDMFAVPFDDIAAIVDRSPAAARQLASRARRRVQEATPSADLDPARRWEIVDAFLAAARNGDFETLVSLLDPDVVLRADPAAVRLAATGPGATRLASTTSGAKAVASMLAGRAHLARPALVDGTMGAAAWTPDGQLRIVFALTFDGGKITEVSVICDDAHLSRLEVARGLN